MAERFEKAAETTNRNRDLDMNVEFAHRFNQMKKILEAFDRRLKDRTNPDRFVISTKEFSLAVVKLALEAHRTMDKHLRMLGAFKQPQKNPRELSRALTKKWLRTS